MSNLCRVRPGFAIFTMLALAPSAPAAHPVLVQGNGKLAYVDESGEIGWQMEWGGIHDIHYLPNGHVMVQQDAAKVVEIDPARKQVVWFYDSASENGNAGKQVEVHSFQPLECGRILIAESGVGRLIEIDRNGKILHEMQLKIDNPHPHNDTRLVRKLATGNYLVCHEGDGCVREYAPDGEIAWEFEVPLFGQKPRPGHGPEAFGNKLFSALRLPNGNTLIGGGNGHCVLEVTPDKEIVWNLTQRELPGVVLAWVTTLEALPNGNYVIGNCHAGPGQPLLIEVNPATKEVVWTFDQFEAFGNSVSNSQILSPWGKALR